MPEQKSWNRKGVGGITSNGNVSTYTYVEMQ